jgi:hypothetical protein
MPGTDFLLLFQVAAQIQAVTVAEPWIASIAVTLGPASLISSR